jgi:DNA-binding NarL/FixJ family response regulator
VLLADDHAATQGQLRSLLQRHFEVIAVVEARWCARLRGVPATRIVLVTVHDEPILVDRGLAAGALGYVLKEMACDERVPAIHSALDARRYVSLALRQRGQRDQDGNEPTRVCCVQCASSVTQEKGAWQW